MSVLRQIIGTDGGHVAYWCQGCDDAHVIKVGSGSGPLWVWDGNRDRPTFSPSVLCTTGKRVCHSFVRYGMVEFLSDCTHALAGQTLPLPPWPYADGEYGGVERFRDTSEQSDRTRETPKNDPREEQSDAGEGA